MSFMNHFYRIHCAPYDPNTINPDTHTHTYSPKSWWSHNTRWCFCEFLSLNCVLNHMFLFYSWNMIVLDYFNSGCIKLRLLISSSVSGESSVWDHCSSQTPCSYDISRAFSLLCALNLLSSICGSLPALSACMATTAEGASLCRFTSPSAVVYAVVIWLILMF